MFDLRFPETTKNKKKVKFQFCNHKLTVKCQYFAL